VAIYMNKMNPLADIRAGLDEARRGEFATDA
jgi:predicted transcriptional regulator